MRPNELAEKLAGKANRVTYGKQVRARLRAWYPRDAALHNASWVLSDEQRDAVTAWHKARVAGKAFDFETWRKARKSRKRTPKVETTDAA